MNAVITGIRRELEARIDPAARDTAQRYFKELVKFYGVKTGEVNRLAARYYASLKGLPGHKIFSLCEELLSSGYNEEAFIALDWSARLHKQYEKQDFFLFERWLKAYIDNWAKCDTLCNHSVGSIVMKYPGLSADLIGWTASENRWVRRGAAVSLVLPARRGYFLDECFEIAQKLLEDKDDLVQKGYGWMLKEAAKTHEDEVFQWILQRRAEMPRTALRYAIEKMPPERRREAMKRD